jgi:hypothetical protein
LMLPVLLCLMMKTMIWKLNDEFADQPGISGRANRKKKKADVDLTYEEVVFCQNQSRKNTTTYCLYMY